MTRKQRLMKMPEYRFASRIAMKQHVSTSNLGVCRACWKAIAKAQRRTIRPGKTKDALHALFLGAIASHKENRGLFARYRF
jgi:hypothetical protein